MMRKITSYGISLLPAVILLFLFSCKPEAGNPVAENAGNKAATSPEKQAKAFQLTAEFRSYWFAGLAEITSYELEQARYGEQREGDAVLIYVTEPFLEDKQVKADGNNPSNISVLKLNSTKKFVTGIYPYSIMTSTFYPLDGQEHALKVTNSVQEWCGQVFAQINNREQYEVSAYSYFESEGDQELKLDKDVLENEIWTQLRVDPESLPTGEILVIPALEYLRLAHRELKGYPANASRTKNGEFMVYVLEYPELQRTLKITYNPDFPYEIEGWSETYKSGFGDAAKMMTSSAKKINTMKIPYWQRNRNKDVILRDSLGLK